MIIDLSSVTMKADLKRVHLVYTRCVRRVVSFLHSYKTRDYDTMGFNKFGLFSALVLLCAGCVWAGYDYSNAQNLYNDITVTNNYNRLLRPSDEVTISIAFTLLSVNFLDIKNQQFSANGWLTVQWTDARFSWNPGSYGGITYMYLTDTSCWTPELVIDNSVKEISLIQDDNLLIKVAEDSSVVWEPPSVYSVHCDVDITYYPFDTQDCGISITSWSYDLTVLVLEHAGDAIDISSYEENGEWTLVRVYKDRVTKQNNKNSLDYAHLEFHFLMTRKATYYVLNVLVPLILISFLGLAVFLLPAESGEKVGFSLTVLLAQAVLMTIVSNTIPTTSKNTSFLGIYLAINLVISTIETLMTVIVLRLHHQEDKNTRMSDRAQRFVRTFLARLACRRRCCVSLMPNQPAPGLRNQPQNNTEKNKETPLFKPRILPGKGTKIMPSDWDEQRREPPQYESPERETTPVDEENLEYSWIQVAEMMDCLSLGLLLIIKLVTTVAFLVILVGNI